MPRVEVTGRAELPKEFRLWNFPAGRFARIHRSGQISRIRDTNAGILASRFRICAADRDKQLSGILAKAHCPFYLRAMSTIFADPKALTHVQLEEGTLFAPRFDPQGLITTIAQEAGSGRVLMVAHMNAEALSKTIATGEVHYFSRSRNVLWKKGETSGEVQKLVELRTDCDQDVLLLTVEQTGRGAACHTGRESCFYRRLDGGQLADTGEPKLFDPKAIYGA